MQKNKIILVVALGMLLLPALKLQARDGALDVRTGVEAEDKIEVKSTLPRVVDPSIKPLRIDDDAKESDDSDEQDDKGGLRAKGESDDDESMSSDEFRTKFRVDIESRKKDLLKRMLGEKSEVRVKLEVKAQERVKKLLENIYNMLGNQIDRLTKVDARIGARIDALKTDGIDVTAIVAQYTVAQAALVKAKVDVEATSSMSIDQTNTETSKSALRSLVKTAEDSIKACAKEYMKIIPMLPERSDEARVEAKSKSSVNVQQ